MASTSYPFTPIHLTPVTCGEYLAVSTFQTGSVKSSLIRFTKGQTIVRSKISASSIWILVSGAATVSFSTSSGQRIARPAYLNEVFGLTEMLARVPFSVTVTAGDGCRFRKLSESAFICGLISEAAIRDRLLRDLSTRYLAVHKLLSQKILL